MNVIRIHNDRFLANQESRVFRKGNDGVCDGEKHFPARCDEAEIIDNLQRTALVNQAVQLDSVCQHKDSVLGMRRLAKEGRNQDKYGTVAGGVQWPEIAGAPLRVGYSHRRFVAWKREKVLKKQIASCILVPDPRRSLAGTPIFPGSG